jgi:hypothetical protein
MFLNSSKIGIFGCHTMLLKKARPRNRLDAEAKVRVRILFTRIV